MKERRYVVFDVETPNRYNSRMSAIGVSVVEGGKIVRDFYSLVDPEQPFDWFNSVLTGINEETHPRGAQRLLRSRRAAQVPGGL